MALHLFFIFGWGDSANQQINATTVVAFSWNTWLKITIGHFTVVCFVTWPLCGSEAGVDFFRYKPRTFHM